MLYDKISDLLLSYLVGKVQPQDFLSLEPCLMLYNEIKFISQEKQKVTESKSLFEMSLISS